ncbi:MAG: glycosyltransferase family 1 protein [Thermoprotei archaeon]|nr:MAG: glycosyltransferase family 1 protein [Thermoprotei archaeon]RLF00141.1 MAG: glycosyltransferase family 1 protein [Thermoprotei archaeon]HDH06799.1 glycosyltransferase family 1 protein [Thermoproteales archaeon]
MKILIISPKSRGIGGVASHVSELASLLKKRGYEVRVLSSENSPIIPLRKMKNLSFALFSALKLEILSEKYDIAHAHNMPSILPLRVSKAETKILTLHGVYSKQIAFLHGKTFGQIAKHIERRGLLWINGLTAVSKVVKNYYESLGLKVEYIPNAINVHKLPKDKIKLYDIQVVYIGRLSKEKGVDILIKAFNRIKTDAHLLIIGKGYLENYLRKLAKNNEKIHFLGYLEHEKALKVIAGSDLLVLPSLYEGLSSVILEAMALKVPVLVSDIEENRELVKHNITGLLFPKGSIRGLSKALEEALLNLNNLKKIADNAYNLVMKEYLWDVVVEKYIKFYEKLSVAENL